MATESNSPMRLTFLRRAQKSKAGSFPCLIQTGEGYAFDFFGAFGMRYDQFWQSTVILAATESATTVLQMTSTAAMTTGMVVIKQILSTRSL